MMMRSRVITPAEVHSELLFRDVSNRVIQCLDIDADCFLELGQILGGVG